MFFAILFSIVIILLLLRLVTWMMGLGYVMAVVVDVLVIGGCSIYYAHNEWFVHIASGKAVYFWDVLLFVLIGFVYGVIVVLGTSMFPRIAGLFHYIIAWITTGFLYVFINYAVCGVVFGLLLDNEQMNTVVHIVIISVLALFIYNSRMRIFKQNLT